MRFPTAGGSVVRSFFIYEGSTHGVWADGRNGLEQASERRAKNVTRIDVRGLPAHPAVIRSSDAWQLCKFGKERGGVG